MLDSPMKDKHVKKLIHMRDALAFDAKMKALAHAARAINKLITQINSLPYMPNETPVKQLVFIADSVSAMKRARNPTSVTGGQYESIKFCTQIRKFLQEDSKQTVHLMWTPSHCNVSPDDDVDKMAKKASKNTRVTGKPS